eukprot:jgi/Tetstr1/423467/TSEL_014148.t1
MDEWKRRWDSDPRWISALLHAADAAHICEFRKWANQFGAKGPFMGRSWRGKLLKLAPVKDEREDYPDLEKEEEEIVGDEAMDDDEGL